MGPGDWWCGLGVALGRNVDGQPSGWTHEVSPHNRAEPSVMLCITYRVDTKLQLTKGDAALTSPWSAHGRPFPIYEPTKLGCGYPQDKVFSTIKNLIKNCEDKNAAVEAERATGGGVANERVRRFKRSR